MNVRVNIIGRQQVAGLCGTPDGKTSNEWKHRTTGDFWPIDGQVLPQSVSDSWKYVFKPIPELSYWRIRTQRIDSHDLNKRCLP